MRSLWYVPSQNKPKFLKKEEEILKIIKEYSPQIRQQCLDYEKYFFQWENANRRGECGISWYEKKELEAWDKADNLFKEEHKKLKEINGMIELFHPMSEKLKPGHEGWVSVKNSLEYLDFLEGFFDKRVKRLSK